MQYRSEQCPLAGVKAPKGGAEETPITKSAIVQQMLEGAFPKQEAHALEIKKNYLCCSACGQMVLRHSSIDKLTLCVRRKCWNESFRPPWQWQGHLTHELWRRGNKVSCLRCGGQALCSEHGDAASSKLKKSCCQTGEQLALFRRHEVEADFSSRRGTKET